jgi:hypothetical protein
LFVIGRGPQRLCLQPLALGIEGAAGALGLQKGQHGGTEAGRAGALITSVRGWMYSGGAWSRSTMAAIGARVRSNCARPGACGCSMPAHR